MDVKIFSRSPEPFFLLAEDTGAIGQILRDFAEAVFGGGGRELLCEAARREVDGDDPWEFLLGVRGIAPQHMKVFRAAQSQRVGWRRLLDKAHGWGKLREKCEQLATAPPGTPIQPCQRQLLARMWRVKRWVLSDDPKLNPEMRAEIERLGKDEDKKLLKRRGRSVRITTILLPVSNQLANRSESRICLRP